MYPLPHTYTVRSAAVPTGDIVITGGDAPPLVTTAPVEFDGPGGEWSPEALLVGAVADCFLITFRGIARASRLAWTDISCEVSGSLDRIDHQLQFTDIDVRARLHVPPDANEELARRVLVRAEETCLITRSLKATTHLHATIEAPALI